MPPWVGLPWRVIDGRRWFFPQGPINAQMLAQRQREILSQHLRQRQMQQQQQQVQQRTLMMRGQGLSMTPSMVATGGIPATMSNPRIPQANAQQFPFPPNYGTGSTPLSAFCQSSLPHVPPSAGSEPLVHRLLPGSLGRVENMVVWTPWRFHFPSSSTSYSPSIALFLSSSRSAVCLFIYRYMQINVCMHIQTYMCMYLLDGLWILSELNKKLFNLNNINQF